jgi:transposase
MSTKVVGIQTFLNTPGWLADRVIFSGRDIQIELRRDRRRALLCPHCGETMTPSRTQGHRVRDIGLGPDCPIWLLYVSVQGRCRPCGRYHTEHPPGVDGRTTIRFQAWVSSMCRVMTLNDAGNMAGIDPSTAWRIDDRHLQRSLPEPNLDGLTHLMVDEKSVRHHHGYVTFVLNARTGEPLHCAEGKRRESLASFFQKLTPAQRASIQAVCMDRSGHFRDVVREFVPHADIVFDKFHIIANYNTTIDAVRRNAWHAAAKQDKSFIKGQRYNLFARKGTLKPERQLELDALLAANAPLSEVYVLGDQLRTVWQQPDVEQATAALDDWIAMAAKSTVEPIRAFAASMRRSAAEIVAYAKHRITNGKMEGFNNLVSRLIHRANGIRSVLYLFRRARAAVMPCVPQSVCGTA